MDSLSFAVFLKTPKQNYSIILVAFLLCFVAYKNYKCVHAYITFADSAQDFVS